MWSVLKGLWHYKGALTLGGLGAYLWSAGQDKKEDQVLKTAVDSFATEVAGPLLYKAGETFAKGAGNIAGSLVPSDKNKEPGADAAVRKGLGDFMAGAQPYVNGGIATVQQLPQQVPQIAGKAGELAGTAVDTSANSLEKFLKGILPESFMPPKWLLAVGATVLGAGGIGSLAGSNVFNMGTVATLASAPFKLVGTALSGALMPLITGGAVVLGVGMLLSPNMRQMAWDLMEGIINLLPGKQKEGHAPAATPAAAPERAAEVAPTSAATPPAPALAQAMPTVDPALMRQVDGGQTVSAPQPQREIPVVASTRDPRNNPSYTAAV